MPEVTNIDYASRCRGRDKKAFRKCASVRRSSRRRRETRMTQDADFLRKTSFRIRKDQRGRNAGGTHQPGSRRARSGSPSCFRNVTSPAQTRFRDVNSAQLDYRVVGRATIKRRESRDNTALFHRSTN